MCFLQELWQSVEVFVLGLDSIARFGSGRTAVSVSPCGQCLVPKGSPEQLLRKGKEGTSMPDSFWMFSSFLTLRDS